MSVWNLQPERKFERGQDAVRGVVARLKGLLQNDVTEVMSADACEVLSLQLKLASVNLNVAARALREVEEERRFLAKELERDALRFEKEEEES